MTKIEMADDAAKLRMRNRRLETVPATDALKKLADSLGAKPKIQMREISELEMSNDLIPGTDELNRLKIFLADFKKQPKKCDRWSDHVVMGLGHDALVDNTMTNYGGPFDVRNYG